MKPIYYLFFILLLFNFSSVAQNDHECGTTLQEQATTYDFVQKIKNQPVFPNRSTINEIPVKFHFIGSTSGLLAADSADIFDELQIVNNHFSGANIEFIHCGNINYILDNSYLTFIKGEDEVLCDIHDKAGAINIYFAPNVERTDGTSLCGYAYNFGVRQRVLMDNGCSTNTSTLAHELGHSFSLLHTHSTSNGQEFANGSNCSIAGDLLCDTPADPRLDNDMVNTDCEYIGTETDNQGNVYAPDTENLMSYSRKACRIHFSAEQLLQMEAYYLVEGSILECTPDVIATPTEELFGAAAIDVFPNPSQSSIFIKNIPDAAQLELIDMTGKILWNTTTDNSVDQYELSAFQALSNGVYFLRVSAEGQVFTKKVIRM